MFNIQAEEQRLKKRYMQISSDLFNYSNDFVAAVDDYFIYSFFMINQDMVPFMDNYPDYVFSQHDFKDATDLQHSYSLYRNSLAQGHNNDIVSYASVNGRDFAILNIPAETYTEASILQTSLDKRSLRRLSKMLSEYHTGYTKLAKESDAEQEQIKQELAMLKTYNEVSGNA